MVSKLQDQLRALRCSEMAAYLGDITLEEVWQQSESPDILFFLIHKSKVFTDVELRLFACDCLRHTPLGDGLTAWDLLTDERSRNALEVTYANGNATEDELQAALSASWAIAQAVGGAVVVAARVAAQAVGAEMAAAERGLADYFRQTVPVERIQQALDTLTKNIL